MNQEAIFQKIKAAFARSGAAGLVIAGADHVQYLSGAALPFLYAQRDAVTLVFYQPEGAVLVCPAQLASTVRAQGWSGDVRTYAACAAPMKAAAETLAKAAAGRLAKGAVLGADLERMPAAQLALLEAALPGVKFKGCDELMNSLRQVKTDEEIALMDDLAVRTDHGVAGAMHHVSKLGSKTEKFQSEDLRVHCMERGLWIEGYNNLSLVASGPHARKFWPVTPRFGLGQEKTFKPGEVVRMEMLATAEGRWSAAARTLVMGEPSTEQSEAYGHLAALRQTAFEAIGVGRTCAEVFAAVTAAAAARKADLVSALGVGHGVGAAPLEAPYFTAWDQTRIEAGMVLVIDLVLRMPGGELLRERDTVLVGAEGARMTDWYQDWREPYYAALTF